MSTIGGFAGSLSGIFVALLGAYASLKYKVFFSNAVYKFPQKRIAVKRKVTQIPGLPD
jgi:hypothetical protein